MRGFRYNDTYEPFDVRVITQTKWAALLFFSDWEEEHWVPKSVMEDCPQNGEEDTVLISSWFCEKEGFV